MVANASLISEYDWYGVLVCALLGFFFLYSLLIWIHLNKCSSPSMFSWSPSTYLYDLLGLLHLFVNLLIFYNFKTIDDFDFWPLFLLRSNIGIIISHLSTHFELKPLGRTQLVGAYLTVTWSYENGANWRRTTNQW